MLWTVKFVPDGTENRQTPLIADGCQETYARGVREPRRFPSYSVHYGAFEMQGRFVSETMRGRDFYPIP
ncbi:hypothetical protein Y1Q_0005099 [Alligator mississippiensis]|uniref:Uncharacterized protein n=1 Tax=Alligator mississippiensis TaxID=8496 RepID=A0A151MUE4_ALLMI|nr:hypothetical protein Y1Q_0005099 [Alligator mississippiensis]